MRKLLNIKRINKIFFLVFSWIPLGLLSQDIHISQFWLSPVAINPAAAGFFDGDIRLGIYNRTQWRAITKAYQTVGVAGDFPLVKRPGKQDLFGMGVSLDYDQAGDSKYTTIQGNLMLSYAHALTSRNNHFLMGGIMLGGVQRSWGYAQLRFDEQWKDGMFNPNIGNNETFYGTNYWIADLGLGIQWFYQPDFLTFFQAGFSVYHLNTPTITMLNDGDVHLPVKWGTHVVTSIEVHPDIAIIPVLYFAYQDIYREFLLGVSYSHTLPIDVKGFKNTVNIGLFHRWKDALYLSAGMEWRRLTIGISYDFNLSDLIQASHARGGVEIALSYIIKKRKYLRQKAIPCTVF
jgi:type IX secretion system PorP/SprF family membrane protein